MVPLPEGVGVGLRKAEDAGRLTEALGSPPGRGGGGFKRLRLRLRLRKNLHRGTQSRHRVSQRDFSKMAIKAVSPSYSAVKHRVTP